MKEESIEESQSTVGSLNEQELLEALSQEEKEIKVWHWHINGIQEALKSGKLQKFLDQVRPGILCLNELNLDSLFLLKQHIPSRLSCYFPKDLQFWHCSKPPVKWIYGAAILINERNGGEKPLAVTYGMGIERYDREGRVVTAEFQKWILVAAYFPHASKDAAKRLDYRLDWELEFFRYVKDLQNKKKKPLIFGGELNLVHTELDLYNPQLREGQGGFTLEERKSFSANLSKFGFVDTFRELKPTTQVFTHWDQKVRHKAIDQAVGERTDYFIASREMMPAVVSSDVHQQFKGSFNCPISVTLDLERLSRIVILGEGTAVKESSLFEEEELAQQQKETIMIPEQGRKAIIVQEKKRMQMEIKSDQHEEKKVASQRKREQKEKVKTKKKQERKVKEKKLNKIRQMIVREEEEEGKEKKRKPEKARISIFKDKISEDDLNMHAIEFMAFQNLNQLNKK